jgi:hypothetical protein
VNHLCIHSSPLPTDPLPGMAASHQPLGTKRDHSLCLSPPELLPAPFFIFHGSPTRLTRMSTPPSSLIITGQHIYHPDPVPVGSPITPHPSMPRRWNSVLDQAACRGADHEWASTPLPWQVHVLMRLDHHIAYAKKGNFSKCSLFLSWCSISPTSVWKKKL